MKKLLCCLFIGCMCFALSGCGGNSYEDTNGADDYSLQTITNENIINMDVGSSGMSYSETKLGGITSTKYSSKNFILFMFMTVSVTCINFLLNLIRKLVSFFREK